MAKRKKRNAVTLVSLLLALVVLIGVYFWYTNRKDTSLDTKQDEQTIPLGTLDTNELTALHFTGPDVDMTLVLEDGVWKSKEEPDRPINQDNVTKMIDTIKDINAKRMVTDAPDSLADFGLEKPVSTLQVTKKDGSTVTLKIGNKATTDGAYYALVNEDKKVYLLDTTYSNGLNLTNKDLTAVENGPEITSENITHIDIMNRDGENYELKLDEKAGIDNSGSDTDSWQLLKPYGEGYTADTSKVSEILANYSSFNFINCVDYKGEDLNQYDLEDPVASVDIGYFETSTEKLDKPEKDPATGKEITEKTINTDKEFKIFIGKEDGFGNRYIRKDGSNAVYTMGSSTIDKMLTIDAFGIMNSYICIPNISTVDTIEADIDGEKYTMEIKRPEGTKADSKEDANATYYYNNKEVTKESFKEVYQKIVTAKYDSEMKEEVDNSKTNPYMTIRYHIQGDTDTTITASYLPYNDSFYIVDKGTGSFFLADKRLIDDIAATIKTFTVAK